jgi:hypothetical protein
MTNKGSTSEPPPGAGETRFVNAMRLNGRQWLWVAVIVTAILLATPAFWKKIERFDGSPDRRIPYGLSRDYWFYDWGLERITPTNIAVIGDSVIWGEYVRPDGTLSHFLNKQPGHTDRFINAGVNGMFPLALEGLVRFYGEPLRRRRIILHCNALWMSSPKADLQTQKEERFNHADLVPQFSPRIPCYKAGLNRRLGAVVERHFTFVQWATHLQNAYFNQKNFLGWTLEEDESNPSRYPNAFKNPFAQITLNIPTEPAIDPERGPDSQRHKAWSATGEGTARFDWVALERSLQWAAFQRLVKLLQSRGNDVLVVIGPFNEHIMIDENRLAFRRLRDGMVDWLAQNNVSHVVPEALPSAFYADASHPLTEGYEMLARRLGSDATFQKFIGRASVPRDPD